MQTLQQKRCQTRTRPRKKACAYGARVPGPTLYNYFRTYQPAHGRYSQNDPVGLAGGLNRMGYANGDGINNVDPFGLCVGPLLILCVNPTVAGLLGGATSLGYAVINGFGGPASAAANAASRVPPSASATINLYRAVKPEELICINTSGAFRNLGSAEGKYFTTSAQDAASYARQAVRGFNDPPYTIVNTSAPASTLRGLTPATVDGGIPAWVVPNNRLPGLMPNVMNYSPIPSK